MLVRDDLKAPLFLRTCSASGFKEPALHLKPNAATENSIRNVAYALLSGADGWMFDGEDASGADQFNVVGQPA